MNTSPYPPIPLAHAGAVLSVDLDAIRTNFRELVLRLGNAECGAVVKANSYGMGTEQVAPVLWNAGCREFFVAHIEEGLRLRAILAEARIHILNGMYQGAEETYREHHMIPVIGSLQEAAVWKAFCGENPLPCDLHVDTGMLRLGLSPAEMTQVTENPDLVAGLDIQNVISHLASADEAGSPQNAQQLAAYRRVREIIPQGRASFCNSSGIFLGSEFHHDLVRPGFALYGGNPTPGKDNPMNGVITLKARIVQVRDADVPETVGYGATHALKGRSRVATVPVGYADGLLRSLSSKTCGYIGEHRVPLIGRVSMDLITFDVTDVPEQDCAPGKWIEMIGPKHSIDDLARDGDTIGYEILTSLGRRYHRIYTGGAK